MRRLHKVSNNFLIYSTGILSILLYIFGVFAVINVVNEANQIGVIESISENAIPTALGIICLILAVPTYRLTKSLRIIEMTDYENGLNILSLYSPLLADDMPQADSKISIKNLKEIKQNTYFKRLVELHFENNGKERIIKSFISPKTIERIKNS
jgi:hypothetical protein